MLIQCTRNLQGKDLERLGRIDQAIILYEQNVAEGFIGEHPYNRLWIIYTRQKRYADAIRVCRAKIALNRAVGYGISNWESAIKELEKRMSRG